MTSEKRTTANRVNARASTGPRSAAGKARSACNALRHGLAARTKGGPEHVAAAVALAHDLAGGGAAPPILAAATRIALAQAELQRVRGRRIALMDGANNLDADDLGADDFGAVVGDLAALDRYERRALSRRKTAIRGFDKAFVEAWRGED